MLPTVLSVFSTGMWPAAKMMPSNTFCTTLQAIATMRSIASVATSDVENQRFPIHGTMSAASAATAAIVPVAVWKNVVTYSRTRRGSPA